MGGKSVARVAQCTLNSATQELINLIFDREMFQETLQRHDIDVSVIPFGKLSKDLIAKGYDILVRLEHAVENKRARSALEDLSRKFYTTIPHNFGRRPQPIIDRQDRVQRQFDILGYLEDMEATQSMVNKQPEPMPADDEVPNPLDIQYRSLKCSLTLLDKESDECQILTKYFDETKPSSSQLDIELVHIWKVDREGEAERFAAHDGVVERKLVWYGTDILVVAAILREGFRIRDHTSGRGGKSLHFASENDKSAGYVHPYGTKGIMFLNEAAIGYQWYLYDNDRTLKKPPEGYDSVLAYGIQEPDPACDTTIILDGKQVVVPQGKPTPTGVSSAFYQSEYLIYQESLIRIRYLLLIEYQ